jgi:hypothetical protein
VFLKYLILNALNYSKKFELIKVATVYTSSMINGLYMKVFIRLKKHDVKRL